VRPWPLPPMSCCSRLSDVVLRCACASVLFSLVLGACAKTESKPTPEPPLVLRAPAVSGSFYPSEPGALARSVDGYLAGAHRRPMQGVVALICPHAGLDYSGPVAGECYAAVRGRKFERVVVISPSHRVAFEGAALSPADGFSTPLGALRVAGETRALAAHPPFLLDAEPHRREHGLELQLPFIQRALGQPKLVPIVLGRVEPSAVAERLLALAEPGTLFVASSDLSHYHTGEEARVIDAQTIEAILSLDRRRSREIDACGQGPIAVVTELARRRGWRPELIDYRHSGDVTGDGARVVGYAAVAFVAADADQQVTKGGIMGSYSIEERTTLLRLARRALRSAVETGEARVVTEGLGGRLFERKGAFVTLTREGKLRGCIGNILPERPLVEAVIQNAESAALRDTRFARVVPEELDELEVEVSVLTVPSPLGFSTPEELLAKLRPKIDGVVLELGSRRATFLPQVWEQLPEPRQFLRRLSEKAGLSPEAYREPGLSISVYQAEAFHESELGLLPHG